MAFKLMLKLETKKRSLENESEQAEKELLDWYQSQTNFKITEEYREPRRFPYKILKYFAKPAESPDRQPQLKSSPTCHQNASRPDSPPRDARCSRPTQTGEDL
jgi:hypothetical protein